jgi:UDP-N-acetylmuramoyl-tripeptide--D-alanyl-D-alanine ligase
VDNVLSALQQLAKQHRQQLKTTVIGITGTNGKTTTKELMAAVLSGKYNTLYTQGNLNNHIGVPLTLLKIKPEHEIAIIEMGANHPGEIKTLAEIACPDYGIITNVGKAHLEGFGSFEGVKKTKAELYDYISGQGEAIFINSDNKHLTEMAIKAGFDMKNRVHTYSLDSENSLCPVHGSVSAGAPFLNMKCTLGNSPDFDIHTKLIGSYNAENVLAAVAIGDFFGVAAETIKQGLENYTPQNNRSQLTVTDRNKLVVDAYNANPTSMRAALLNFGEMDVEHKVVILGDMLELGDQSDEEHQNIVRLIGQFAFEKVILVGPQFKKTQHNFESYENIADLKNNTALLHGLKNCYVLIKGSRGIQLEQLLSAL